MADLGSYVSGNLTEEARLIVINESNWTIEHSSIIPAGNYIISSTGGGTKTVVALPTTSETEPLVYNNIVPAE